MCHTSTVLFAFANIGSALPCAYYWLRLNHVNAGAQEPMKEDASAHAPATAHVPAAASPKSDVDAFIAVLKESHELLKKAAFWTAFTTLFTASTLLSLFI